MESLPIFTSANQSNMKAPIELLNDIHLKVGEREYYIRNYSESQAVAEEILPGLYLITEGGMSRVKNIEQALKEIHSINNQFIN